MKLKDMLSGMGQDTEKQILHDLTCGIYKSQFIGAECRTSDCQGLEEMQRCGTQGSQRCQRTQGFSYTGQVSSGYRG